MQNGFAKQAPFRQSTDGATGHSISSSLSSIWVSDSFMNLWPVLTELQPFHGKRASGETTKVNPSEESLAYERARQQNAREEMSRLKGKAKNIPTDSTSSSSKPPPYSSTWPSLPPSTTTIDDAAHARALQAQLDSERASYELARRLQAQEEAAIQEHRRLVQDASRVQLFDCVICMEKLSMDYSAPIASCGHVLCRTCMKEHVQSQVDQSIWPIRCPNCVADHTRTEENGGEHRPAPLDSAKNLSTVIMSVITRNLVETLGIDEAVLVKWMRLEMEMVSVAVECPR